MRNMFFHTKKQKSTRTQASQAQLRTFSLKQDVSISYLLIYDSFKTLRLRIRKKTEKDSIFKFNTPFIIEVKAPKKCSQKYIEEFLSHKADWIRLKIRELTEQGTRPDLDFQQGAQFFCLGRVCSFFYRHAFFSQNTTPSNSFSRRVFGNFPKDWEYFYELPLDKEILPNKENLPNKQILTDKEILPNKENLLSTHESDVQKKSPILAHISPRTASYETYFIPEKDAFRAFWQIADTAHRNFSLKMHSLNTDSTQEFKNLALQERQALLCIKTKFEDFDLKTFSQEGLDDNAYDTVYSKVYFQEKYEKSIRTWRKKSASLFLEFCFDSVWEGLCGRLDFLDHQIPEKWQLYFQSLQKPTLKVKHLTRRFGSCSTKPKAEITLAIHLISFPLGLIEYVIIHECCHLMFMDHSKNFYALMEECCPRSLQKRELLWEWSASHVQF